MKKFWAYFSVALMSVSYSHYASAVSQTCLSIQAFIQAQPTAGCTGTCLAARQDQIAFYQANHPECFGSTSSTAAASQEINSTSISQMLAISHAVTARNTASRPENVADAGQRFGVAAGSPASQWNVWGSVSGDKNKYDRGGFVDAGGLAHNNTANTNVTNAVIGGDYQVTPNMAVGVSAAFDSGSGNTQSFTSGVSNGVSATSTSGYTIAPYLGLQINKEWSVDAMIGTGSVKLNTSDVTGKANRLFYGTNLSYASWMGNWQLTGKGSYLHGEEKYNDLTAATTGALMAGTASTNKLSQLRVGGQAGYWMNENVMPYFGLSYASDLSRSTSATAVAQMGTDIGKTAWVYSLGVNFFSLRNSMTGGIAYNQEVGRTYAKNNNLMGNINVRF
ncbi:MAG: autotransporter outer membrane beta-barrel domain-containing protein [Gallionella sp.]|nr:autotransporter outer membrane beta-barrel domain-containing protein [Gallionella sp.]